MDIETLEALAFADASTGERARALALLVPGTEDYYFHHCLNHQHRGELDRVDALLPAWIERHGRTGRVQEIERRQALLRYDSDPEAALAHVRTALGLRFDHQRQVEGRDQAYPTALDPSVLDRDTLAARALRRARDLSGFTDRALEWLVTRELDSTRRRHLLERIRRPDVPGLVELVAADLAEPSTPGFGSLAIHRALLPEQLDALAERSPALWESGHFVAARLAQERPGPDVDWHADAGARRAYLERLWTRVEPLSPVFNWLKSMVLYHLLELDRRQGTYERERFLAYVRLPRRSDYVPEERWQQIDRRFVVTPGAPAEAGDAGRQVHAAVGLELPEDDEDLVRDYLVHFLVDADDTSAFAGFIREDLLRFVFASSKLLAGVGDVERWAAMLDDPAQYKALADWVDLELAPQNPRVVGADEPVRLDVYVKNVSTLVVKVFEIDVRNYFLVHGRDIDTSVDLDGMTATHEMVHTYDDAPVRRVRRSFSFAMLDRPGVYVIEFLGGGRSSRALIRKGGLRFVERVGAAGHVFTIFDESGRHLTDATLWLGGREYTPREDGRVVVPFSTRPRRETLLLCHGEVAVIDSFDHKAERYALDAHMFVEREQLVAGHTAAVLIRPRLRVHGRAVPIRLVEEPTLRITARDRSGVSTHADVDIELRDDRETVHTFAVPPQLAHISFVLRGKVRQVSAQRDVELSAQASFEVNGIDATAHTEDVHLSRTSAGHVLHLLGKSGEVRAGQPVNVRLRHRDVAHPVDVTLQSDDRGRIELGPLEGVLELEAQTAGGLQRILHVRGDQCGYPRSVHASAGETLSLPYMHEPGGGRRVSLLEVRRMPGREVYVADLSAQVEIADRAMHIRDLEPGDYDLALMPEGTRIRVRVTRGQGQAQGQEQAAWVAGSRRLLERGLHPTLAVPGVDVGEDAMTIRVARPGKDTRVHVVATRFASEPPALGALAMAGAEPGWVEWEQPGCAYVSGRDIGDEYRYILERRHAGRFPGVMLERPSLLLNPWARRSTSTEVVRAREGEAYAAGAPQRKRRAERSRAVSGPRAGRARETASLDFLPRPAAVLANLVPDDHGVVRVERSALGMAQCVHILAVDARGWVYRHIALPEVAHEHRDLRLRDSLSGRAGDAHWGESKQIAVLRAGERLSVADTATYVRYDSIARVYDLLMALSSCATLAEFGFLRDWPGMDAEHKRARYSEYACHELSLFLSRKDPAFFDQVIRPYLASKLHKTFMDAYLLGADLTLHTELWAYGRLNIVERILLARRLGEAGAPIRRQVRELFELVPPDVERDSRLFEAALRGDALTARGGGGPGSGPRPGVGGGPAAPPALPAPAAMAMAAPAEVAAEMEELAETSAFGALADEEMLDMQAREQEERLYRPADTTQEWAENNYYRRPMSEQGSELVEVNAFWRDFAEHDADRPFLSPHIAHAAGSFTEMMLALAVLDVPFEAGAHEVTQSGAGMEMVAASPCVVFHKAIAPVSPARAPRSVLVSQSYVRRDDRYEFAGHQAVDKYVTGELLVHVVYVCQVVITNPTARQDTVDVLMQIPEGAVPVDGGFYTRSLQVALPAHGTHAVEYAFYFPRAGTYPHYPAQVTRDGELVAAAEPATLTVVERLSRVNTSSWAYVSQHGSDDQVLAYLDAHNIARLDLGLMAWRMRERGFYQRAVEVLRRRRGFHRELWSYSVLHDDPAGIRELLAHEDGFVSLLGGWLDTPLLDLDPVARVWYEHLEYAPLIHARAHRLGDDITILNRAFERQYRELLRQLIYRPAPGHDERLAATYYLLLQDRIGAALDMFERVDGEEVTAALQYVYVRLFVALYRGRADEARQIAEAHRDHPVDRWRKRFQAALATIDEATGSAARVVDQDDRDQAHAHLAAAQPSFDVAVDSRTVTVTYRNLRGCRVNYYPMDIELLFSRQPFLQERAERFSIIKPRRSEVIELDADAGEHVFGLPGEYDSANVIVEVVAAGHSVARACYANQLLVQLADRYAQVRVYHRPSKQPLPATYVKVYARRHDGQVVFYKDGYTDLRGCFDYASLSTDELDHVERFALLIVHDDHGALIREAAPPKR